MSATHPACGKSWGGYRAEHCAVCCETFSGTSAGDRHRKGPFTARVCADPASVGLHQDSRGVWRMPAVDGGGRVWGAAS
jgi:hypothetical protein